MSFSLGSAFTLFISLRVRYSKRGSRFKHRSDIEADEGRRECSIFNFDAVDGFGGKS